MDTIVPEVGALVVTNRKTLRVLIVEDHAAFRGALAVVLDSWPGLEAAAQAGSLAEARACLRSDSRGSIDAAVVDLGLPDGDGTELVKELAEAEPGVPVLVLTDRLDLESRALAVRAGARAVLSKGVGLGRILDALGRIDDR